MAQTHKKFNSADITNTKTLLHEAIPLTGTIVSGTYSDNNIKDYSHGMFQSVYDYPYLSSSANHIFDITVGYHSSTHFSSSANTQNAKKINLYNQMAQVLMGHDATGSVLKFDEDGDMSGGDKIDSAYFVNFSRLLTKDEIKKGTFELTLGVNNSGSGGWGGWPWAASSSNNVKILIKDTNAQNDYRVNSPAGDYGILYATQIASGLSLLATDNVAAGLIFYQAGVVVLSSSIFQRENKGGMLHNTTYATYEPIVHPVDMTGVTGSFASGSISGSADGLRNRIVNLTFNNTTELNSTVYFCRINHNDFNYSSNPTYLTGSKIRTKNNASDPPVTFVTSIGLYSADQQLLAVGKLSEPIKNDPTLDMTLRVRLDY